MFWWYNAFPQIIALLLFPQSANEHLVCSRQSLLHPHSCVQSELLPAVLCTDLLPSAAEEKLKEEARVSTSHKAFSITQTSQGSVTQKICTREKNKSRHLCEPCSKSFKWINGELGFHFLEHIRDKLYLE